MKKLLAAMFIVAVCGGAVYARQSAASSYSFAAAQQDFAYIALNYQPLSICAFEAVHEMNVLHDVLYAGQQLDSADAVSWDQDCAHRLRLARHAVPRVSPLYAAYTLTNTLWQRAQFDGQAMAAILDGRTRMPQSETYWTRFERDRVDVPRKLATLTTILGALIPKYEPHA